jgi:phosphopantetheinyl transferase
MQRVDIYVLSKSEIERNYDAVFSRAGDVRRIRAATLSDRAAKLLCLGAGYLLDKYVTHGEISYNSFGKPYCEAAFFSLSHSIDIVVLAVCKGAEVGVDVEKRRTVNADLIPYCLSESETDLDFLDAFCAKESLAKAQGEGLRRDVKGVPALPQNGAVKWKGREFYRVAVNYDGYAMSVTASEPIEVVLNIEKI